MLDAVKQKVGSLREQYCAPRLERAQMGNISNRVLVVIVTLVVIAVGALVISELNSAIDLTYNDGNTTKEYFDLSGTAETVFNLFTVTLIVAVAGTVLYALNRAMQ